MRAIEQAGSSVKTINVIRYVAPLREGGSLPGIVEADDWGTYVLKFVGAGQGDKVLLAELVCTEIARVLGLPVPEIAFAELDSRLGRNESDPEIQDLITSSAGLNLAIDYLPGAFAFDAQDVPEFDPLLASKIVWFDAFIANVDRTARNPNILKWGGRTWLIDNGAAIYFQYAGPGYHERANARFPQIRDHILLQVASEIERADRECSERLDESTLREIVNLIPVDWLTDDRYPGGPEEQRQTCLRFLADRLTGERAFVNEAIDARADIV